MTTADGAGVTWDPAPLPATQAQAEPPAPGLRGIVTAFVGLGIGVGLTAILAVVIDRTDDPPTIAVEVLLSSAALWTGLLGALAVVSRRRGTHSIVQDFGFRFRWKDLGFGLAGAIVGRIIATVSILPLPLLDPDWGERGRRTIVSDDVTGWTWAAVAFVACVGAPVIEELFFRGLLQNRLVQRYGVGVGIPVASVLFGAAHLIGWEGLPTAVNAWAVTFGGLVLGATYHYSRRLGASIIAHALFNVVAIAALWFSRT